MRGKIKRYFGEKIVCCFSDFLVVVRIKRVMNNKTYKKKI